MGRCSVLIYKLLNRRHNLRRTGGLPPPVCCSQPFEFREWLRRHTAERRRFGYRRLHILLRREGIKLNHKKLSGSTGKSG